MSPLGRGLCVRRNDPLPTAGRLPASVFPPRQNLVEVRDGKRYLCQLNRSWPIGEKIDWQLVHDDRATHLERLSFHYLEFLEALDVEQSEAVLLNWIRENPPWQPEYWLTSWNSYAVSIRTVCTMQWLESSRDRVSTETFDTVAASVVEQIRFLHRNLETDIRGNHLIRNIKALLWAGSFFEGAEASTWFRRGSRLLWLELESQFHSDGMHFELSPAYHCQVFADLLECATVLGAADRSRLILRLEPAAQVVADLTHPDGRISLFSDGGLHMGYSPEQCLDLYEQLGGTRPMPRSVFRFEDAGYYGIRTGDGYLAFDCGPSCADTLPAHGHGDILAFEWDVDGRRIAVDAGVREYEAGLERDWNRSTRAHNTVTVGDRDQCEFVKSFRVGHRAHGQCTHAEFGDGCISVTGSYTARSNDGQWVNHTRTVTGSPASFRVIDRLNSRISESAVARILLHHDCDVQAVSDTGVTIARGGTRVRLEAKSPVQVCRSKWSPDFGTEHDTIQLEICYGNTPCESGFTLTAEND